MHDSHFHDCMQSACTCLISLLLFHSGRLRQTASDVQAQIRILVDDSEYAVLTSPDPTSLAWQWVSMEGELEVNSTLITLTVELSLVGANTTGRIAYFDELCLSFSQPCKCIGCSGGADLIQMYLLVLCSGQWSQPYQEATVVS